MNEQLQQALIELINKSMDLGGDALAFTQQQLPEVIEQLLLWKGVQSGLQFLLSLFFIGAAIWAGRKFCVEQDVEKYAPAGIGTIFFGVAAMALMNLTWLQVSLAPKVYLLEYAANFAK